MASRFKAECLAILDQAGDGSLVLRRVLGLEGGERRTEALGGGSQALEALPIGRKSLVGVQLEALRLRNGSGKRVPELVGHDRQKVVPPSHGALGVLRAAGCIVQTTRPQMLACFGAQEGPLHATRDNLNDARDFLDAIQPAKRPLTRIAGARSAGHVGSSGPGAAVPRSSGSRRSGSPWMTKLSSPTVS